MSCRPLEGGKRLCFQFPVDIVSAVTTNREEFNPMTNFHRAAIILCSACSLAAAASDVQQDAADLDRKVDQVCAAYNKPDTPGCALGIVRDGEFIYKKAYGTASLELGVPLTPQSVFYMGSVSKQFTAASVVLAAEQGYLSLDDDVHKYIPELPDYGHSITLRQMLHHTSGFRNYSTLLYLSRQSESDIRSKRDIIDLVERQ